MSTNWQRDVEEFHREVTGHAILEKPTIPGAAARRLRRELIKEESRELLDAIDTAPFVPYNLDKDDHHRILAKVADGAADLIVVVLGACSAYGIDLQEVWDEVHRTNMAKKGGGRRADGKLLKPEGWVPPDLVTIIKKQIERE